jgi:hypothetical protein
MQLLRCRPMGNTVHILVRKIEAYRHGSFSHAIELHVQSQC